MAGRRQAAGSRQCGTVCRQAGRQQAVRYSVQAALCLYMMTGQMMDLDGWTGSEPESMPLCHLCHLRPKSLETIIKHKMSFGGV